MKEIWISTYNFDLRQSGVPLRTSSDVKKVEKFLQNYRDEGLDVVLMKQKEIYHYCLVDIAPDKITIRILEVTGDSGNPVRLVEEIVIPTSP